MTAGKKQPGGSFGERVQMLIHRVKGAGELARRAGVSRQMVEKYASGSEPTREKLVALARAAGVNIEWLATGQGPMRLAEARDFTKMEEPREGYVALPRYDVRAAAGAGAIVEAETVVDWIYFKRDWLRRTLGVSPSELAIIEAVGDSMVPTIDDGDLMIVDLSQPKLNGDGIYVLSMDDSLAAIMVKRIEITPRGGLIISSDNARAGYGRYEIAPGELDQVRIVGRVVWVGGRI